MVSTGRCSQWGSEQGQWCKLDQREEEEVERDLALGTNHDRMNLPNVKNGFSNPTKEQEGQDQQRKDVTNDRQGKALREGCHERKMAWTSVSSREKKDTNRNLARATSKSRSDMQTVSNGRVGRGERNRGV